MLGAALVAVLVSWTLASPAVAIPAADAVAKLNAQRIANGLPGGIAHDTEWSRWCALHNRYQELNGGGLTHDENAASPGYTPEGDQAAGASVLSRGHSWARANPWETAPIHLHQLLAPRLDRMG